jgi:hypothetical protein
MFDLLNPVLKYFRTLNVRHIFLDFKYYLNFMHTEFIPPSNKDIYFLKLLYNQNFKV